MNDLNIVIRRLRLGLGLSQAAFGQLTGLSVSTVSALEKGTRKLSQEAYDRVCEVLQLSSDEVALIAVEDLGALTPAQRRLAEGTRSLIVQSVLAQCQARAWLGVLADSP